MKIYEDWQQGTRYLVVVACDSAYSTVVSTVPSLQWIGARPPGLHVLLAGHCLGLQTKTMKQKMEDGL